MSRRKKRKLHGGSGSRARINPLASPSRKASQPKAAFHSPWVSIAVCLFLALAVWAIYGQTRGFGFVYFDDDEYVFNNPQITQGLSFKAISWAFTHIHSHNWHPLTTLTHMFDCQVYGLHPWGHHLENVLLHGMAAILLFVALQKMTGALWRSAFVAAVFAVHPLHVESVAWISERKDALSGLFFMLTLMAYVRYTRAKESGTGTTFLRFPSYWVALLLFALGLMCKPMLVTLPFVLLLLDWWPLQRFTLYNARSTMAGLVREKIPFLLLSAASCPVTIWAQKDIVMSLEEMPFPLRVEIAFVCYVAYVGKMFYPVRLAALYLFPEHYLAPWRVGLSVLFLLLVSMGVSAARRKHPFLLTGWLWYLVMLLPVIGLMQTGNQAMADRYTYLPQIGLYIIVAWGAVDLFCSWRWRYRPILIGAGPTAILATLLVLAHAQTTYWQNGVTIMTRTIACTSDNYFAHDNLAVALATQGNLTEAIEHYERAIQLKPTYYAAHSNLAAALASQGKIDEAIEHFQRAIQLKPLFADAHNNLGNVLATQGRRVEAIEQYEQAIQLKPDYFDAHYNLGNALATQGKMVEAIQHYEQAIQIKPDHAEAHNNLANVLVNQGKMVEAIEHYERAIQISPNYLEAHYNLGNILAEQGNLPEAVQHFQKALDLATAQKNDALAEMIRTRLKSYESPSFEIRARSP